MLYKSAIITYKIEAILAPLDLNCNRYSMAEILLLQIKMNGGPVENRVLLADFMDNFPNENFLKYYDVLELLIINKIINKFDTNKKIFYKEFNCKEQPNNMPPKDGYYMELKKSNIMSPLVSV